MLVDKGIGAEEALDSDIEALDEAALLQGTPPLEMTAEDFTLLIQTGVRTHFLTATAAGRQMAKKRVGVLLVLSSSEPALSGRDRRFHRTGGISPACAAIKALIRSLAGELSPHVIRVLRLRPDALP